MGFTPTQVDQMSLWQFMAALQGWQIANGQREKPLADISEDRFRAMGIEGF